MSSKPTPSPAPAPTRRTRTDPTLKWLLNERAAIAGVYQAATEVQHRLLRRVQRARLLLEQAERRWAEAQSAAQDASEKLRAFDLTIAQLSEDVDPAALGVVRAWQGRFGERGALTAFLLERVKRYAPSPVGLPTLVDEVEQEFGIKHFDTLARKRLRYSVRTCLRQLHTSRGVIEPYRNPVDPRKNHGGANWSSTGCPRHSGA